MGLTSEYGKAGFSFVFVSYFLEHKRVGGFLNLQCFQGAQSSDKVQHCQKLHLFNFQEPKANLEEKNCFCKVSV